MSLVDYTDEQLKEMFGADAEYLSGLRNIKLAGPFTVDQLLDNCFSDDYRPPEAQSVYLITRNRWEGTPSIPSVPLYVGSNKTMDFLVHCGIFTLKPLCNIGK